MSSILLSLLPSVPAGSGRADTDCGIPSAKDALPGFPSPRPDNAVFLFLFVPNRRWTAGTNGKPKNPFFSTAQNNSLSPGQPACLPHGCCTQSGSVSEKTEQTYSAKSNGAEAVSSVWIPFQRSRLLSGRSKRSVHNSSRKPEYICPTDSAETLFRSVNVFLIEMARMVLSCYNPILLIVSFNPVWEISTLLISTPLSSASSVSISHFVTIPQSAS